MTSSTVFFSNYLDIIPDDCMEIIYTRFINLQCDSIDNEIEKLIDQLLEVVQFHYENVKYIKNPQKIFNHAWGFSAFRTKLLNC